MDYGTRPGVHEATNFRIFSHFKKKQEKKTFRNFLPDSKTGPKGKIPVTGIYGLFRKISPEKNGRYSFLAGMVLLDGATKQKYHHTSSRSYEHLCGSIATVTTDTDATLHSTQRKRSRFIITLNTQYLLSFVIAYSNSKTWINLASLLPTQADPIFRFSNRSLSV